MVAPRRRWLLAVGYLMMAGGGATALVWPAPAVATATTGFGVLLYTWDVFLLAGGLLALFGALTDRWVGEYLGLPLLAAVFATYGVTAFALSWASGRPSSVAGALVLGSIAFLLGGRWREVSLVRRRAGDSEARR